MSKKIYNAPSVSIVGGFELLQSMPIVTSGTLDGDDEGQVLGKENDILDDDEEEEEEEEKPFSANLFKGFSASKWKN